MGSFANSIHVRADDSAGVVEAVSTVLLAKGYEPSDQAPHADDWGIGGPLRAVRVSKPRDGWVSLLDSELLGIEALAGALSEHLGADVLTVAVNDSDNWVYTLFRSGELEDAFDSMSEEDFLAYFDDDMADELGEMLDDGDVDGMQERLLEHMQQFHDRLAELMPDEMRDIHERLQSAEPVDAAEMQRYEDWTQSQMPRLVGQVNELLSEMFPGLTGETPLNHAAAAASSPPDEDELREHLPHLRPLLAPGVGDSQVIEALSARSTFAEDDLRSFLPLLGIAPIYADLSYRYLVEFTERELAEEGVAMAEDMMFELGAGGAPY
ncbi:MAG: hypothetical protein U9R79_01475 [Armatimonadota bacterium]|nr:hypothetical protein [Armatimonadota bacterium]